MVPLTFLDLLSYERYWPSNFQKNFQTLKKVPNVFFWWIIRSATLAVEEAEEAAIRARAQPLPERKVEDFANVQAPPLAVPATPLAVTQDEDPDVETTAAVAAPKVVETAKEVQVKAGAEQQAEERENYTDKNKNRRRQCPMCTLFGTHLDRHIRVKHNDTSEVKIKRLMVQSDKGTADISTGKPLYQCHYMGCTKIVTRMSQHLKKRSSKCGQRYT